MKADRGHAFRLQGSYCLSESFSDEKPSCLCYHAIQLRGSVIRKAAIVKSVRDVDVGKNIMEERSSWCGSVEAKILPRNFDHLPQNRHRRRRWKQVSWREQLDFCLDGGIGTENMKADRGHAFRLQRSFSLSESASDGKPSCLCHHANQPRRSVVRKAAIVTSVSDVDVNIMERRSSWCGSVEAEILPRNFDHLPQNRHR